MTAAIMKRPEGHSGKGDEVMEVQSSIAIMGINLVLN